jgi:hypothetical protein
MSRTIAVPHDAAALEKIGDEVSSIGARIKEVAKILKDNKLEKIMVDNRTSVDRAILDLHKMASNAKSKAELSVTEKQLRESGVLNS